MAITYPLTAPVATEGVTSVTFYPTNATVISKSPFTYQGQVQSWGGQILSADVSIQNVMRDSGESWISFLTALKGSKGTFLLGDPMASTPMGSATANVAINTAVSSGASSISIKNGTASKVGFLKAGDWIQINNRLYKNLKDVTTNASGVATLDIWPDLRSAVAVDAVVTLLSPKGLFRLSSGSFEYSIDNSNKYSISFTCEEAL